MRETFEKIMPEGALDAETQEVGKRNFVEDLYSEALKSESFEEASVAVEKIETLQDFRLQVSGLPFGSFWEAVETISNLNKAGLAREEKNEKTEAVVNSLIERAGRFSPRVADFYQALLAEISGEKYDPYFEINKEKIDVLKTEYDTEVLFSPDTPWEMKINRIETRLLDYLKGLRALDKREGKEMDDDIRQWREQELKKAPTNPPQRRNESQPGVDPMERLKEGERAPAIWTIEPAWGGYYKEQSFSQWDNQRNVWFEKKYEYSDVEAVSLSGNTDHKKGPIDITMRANVFANQWISLPIPYTHSLHKVEASGRNCQIQQDQNRDVVIFVEGGKTEAVEIDIFLAPSPNKQFKSKEPEKIQAPDMPANLSEQTNEKLDEIAKNKRGNIARAKAIKRYVVQRIQYLAPKDRKEAEYFNNIYRTSPEGFVGSVDEIRKGDCDVVNTYFAGLCSKLDIPVRHCVGHSVKGKDKEGRASINSGTGHGWSEVWDEIKKVWTRMDATPAGDPNLEDQDESKDNKDEAAPGDYGGQEAVSPTDEQLEDLRKKLAERKEELSYTKEERQLAESAGVELKEARQIIKEINQAEQARLPNGELVVDALSRVFNAIVESRKTTRLVYQGPVRKREGGEAIEDIVRHKIGIMAGDTDPLSRERPKQEIKEEKTLGGFDVYIIGDKSGSMGSEIESETLWQIQRRAEYLIFSSLHRFKRNLERAFLQKENTLSVRTQGISFRDSGPDDIDLDKPLSSEFTSKDKVKMWRSLTERGSGNGDTAALSYVYEQIKKEIEDIKKRGAEDNRLRIVIACSDGEPDSPSGVRGLAEKIGKQNVVVVGMGLTETAKKVPIIFNTEFSKGDIAYDINDLPGLVAKHIILEAIKLFPEKAKENAQGIIKSALAKFNKIK